MSEIQKNVTRAVLYFDGRLVPNDGEIHFLLAQRPFRADRDKGKLSKLGGSDDPQLNRNRSYQESRPHQILRHLKNEINLVAQPSDLTVIQHTEVVEKNPPREKPGTTIRWLEVAFMLRLSRMETFIDQQEFQGLKRAIEWFTVRSQARQGLIFIPDKKSSVPLGYINGKDGSEGFTAEDIAFNQYHTLFLAYALILSEQLDSLARS